MSNLTKNWKFCPICANRLSVKAVENKDKLSCSNGHFIFYDNPQPVVAALVVKNKSVLLVRRAVEPFIGEWCLPRGYIGTDERPKQAVTREVLEETGLHIWLKRILCQFNPSPKNFPLNQVTTLFLAVPRGGKLEAGSDCMDAKFFSFEDLPPICFQTDIDVIAQWQAGSHGSLNKAANFPLRSEFLLPGETRSDKGHVIPAQARKIKKKKAK